MTRDQIFISYSHADSDWLKRLQIVLAPLRRRGILKVWADTDITPGQQWKEEIKQALSQSQSRRAAGQPGFSGLGFYP